MTGKVLKNKDITAPLSLKQMLSYQIEREMAYQDINRVKMAALMKTSRAALNRLLDPNHPSVTLSTLERAAEVLNRQWHIFLKEK
jgi:antitoxin HicB